MLLTLEWTLAWRAANNITQPMSLHDTDTQLCTVCAFSYSTVRVSCHVLDLRFPIFRICTYSQHFSLSSSHADLTTDPTLEQT